MLHVFLGPLILGTFLGVHYYKVVLHGASLPPQMEEVGQDTAKRIPMDRRVYFTPDILTNELTWFGLTSFIMVVMCIWFFHAPLEHHANPQATPLHVTAPWYFLWLQGLLKLGDKIFWGLVIPTGLLGAFFVWPYLDVARSRRYAHRRFGLSMMLIFLVIMLFLTYMGTPKYGVDTAGDQEIAQELAPVEGVGPVRALPFDAWINGTYCTDDLDHNHILGQSENFKADLVEWGAPEPPVLILPDTRQPVNCQAVPAGLMHDRIMEEYVSQIKRWGTKLPNIVAILNVSDNQKTNPDDNGQTGKPKLRMVNRQVSDKTENVAQAPAIQDSGKTIFINRLSEYHETE